MPETAAVPPGDEWAGERVARWLEMAPQLERQLAPASELLFAAAAIEPGERVLDIGCGTGPTTRAAAALTGSSGRVTGLDVSGEMLAAAVAAYEPHDGDAPVDWVQADAVTWAAPAAAYDLVISRFGVMFFSDPPAAARAIATTVRTGGRFVAAVWGERPDSPLFEVPYQVARTTLAGLGRPAAAAPTDGGPFSWHDSGYVTNLLTAAGFGSVTVRSHALRLLFGGGVPPAQAAIEAEGFGPTRLVLAGADAATTAAVRAALTAEFAGHLDEAGHVVLDATVRIISAVR